MAQELSPAQLTPVTLAQSHTLQTSSTQQQGAVQHAYIPGNWNYRGYRESLHGSPGWVDVASVIIETLTVSLSTLPLLYLPSLRDTDDGTPTYSVCDRRGQHSCLCSEQWTGEDGE